MDQSYMTGPNLPSLTHRLSECPPDFLEDLAKLEVAAIVADTLQRIGGQPLTEGDAQRFSFNRLDNNVQERNRLHVVVVACWLLNDPWFVKNGHTTNSALSFLLEEVSELSKIVPVQKFLTEPDRREELVRLCIKRFDVLPEGESAEYAADRLKTLSTLERQRVVRESREAEERAQTIREAMAKKAAAEAAVAFGRE